MIVRRFVWLAAIAGCSTADPPAVVDSTYTVEKLTDPETCKDCHPRQYKEWSGSMHAYATDDPLFVALNKRAQESNVGAFCVKCHAPMAVHLDQTDGTLDPLRPLPKRLRGVTCYFCHNADAVLTTHNNPIHLADDVVMRGEYRDAVPNQAHRSAYSTYLDGTRTESAAMCGSCHDIVNRHETPIERTYAEWQKTVFGQGATGALTCAQCHMSSSTTDQPIAEGSKVSGVFSRKTHSHMFPAVDLAITDFPEMDAQRQAVQEFLDTELQTALCVRGSLNAWDMRVIVDNVGGGHRFPTGAAQDRRLWFEVRAFKEGQEIYKSGVIMPGTEPTSPAMLESDPDLWLLRDCVFDADGKETHDFWNAVSFEGNTLPGQLTIDRNSEDFYKSHVYQTYPRARRLTDFPDRVTMRAWLQPFPLDFFDDAFADPPDHGYTMEEVQAMKAKLAPLAIGKELEWTFEAANDKRTGGQIFLEKAEAVRCVTNTNSNAGADKVPAVSRTKCAP